MVCRWLEVPELSFLLFPSSDKFILRGDETEAVLNRLVGLGKKLFLITNSPFSFVYVSALAPTRPLVPLLQPCGFLSAGIKG